MSSQRKWLVAERGNKTQQEIADKVGIERAFYTQIENGSRNPSVTVAKRISKIMGFNWTLFFEEKCSENEQDNSY